MYLVAFVGKDHENWGQITALMHRLECEQIILVVEKNVENFPTNEKCKIIEIDGSMQILELKKILVDQLIELVGKEFDVALSLASGNGKEHMALLSALLSVPVGIRIVVYTKEGVHFLS